MKNLKKSTVAAIVLCLICTAILSGCIKGRIKPSTFSTMKTTATSGKTTFKNTITNTKSTIKTTGTSGQFTDIDSGDIPVGGDEGSNNAGEVPEEIQEEIINLEGRELVFTYLYANSVPKGGIGRNDFEYFLSQKEKTEQKFNCKIKYELTNQAGGVQFARLIMQNVLAGVQNPDIIQMQNTLAFPTLTNAKAVLPIDDILGPDEEWDSHPQKSGAMWLGKCYGLYMTHGYPGLFAEGIVYNRNLLAKEGIKDLKDYLYEGNWNWGTLLDVARIGTRDYNGDGIIDQWGLDKDNKELMFYCLLHSNGQNHLMEIDGRYVIDFTEPAIMRTLNYFMDLFVTYKVIEVADKGWAAVDNNFVSMKSLMRIGRPPALILNLVNMNSDFKSIAGVIPTPIGPDTQNPIYGSYASNFYSFPSNIDEAEKVVKVMRYYFTSYDDMQAWKDNQKLFYWDNDDDIELMVDYGMKVVFTNEQSWGLTNVRNEINKVINSLSLGQITVGTGVESISNKLQVLLDTSITY